MTSDVENVVVKKWGPDDVAMIVDAMTLLYGADFVPPDLKAATPDFYSEERFRQRVLEGYRASPGFTTVTISTGDELAGFVTGANLEPEAGWWNDLTTPADIDTTETGARTLALFDLVVRTSDRGRRFGSRLHEAVLDGRSEERVTLLSSPPQQPAYDMWLHWGYRVVGKSKPDPAGPELDVFIRPLR